MIMFNQILQIESKQGEEAKKASPTKTKSRMS